MALAAAPFGIRPLKGERFRTKTVLLQATHAAIGIHHPILGAEGGATPNTNNTQTGFIGVSLEYKAANTGGYLLCVDPRDVLFEIQSSLAGTSWTTELAAVAGGYDFTGTDTAIDSNTFRSKASVAATEGDTKPLLIQYLSQVAGNDLTDASFPIWVVRFNTATLIGAAGL